MIPLNKPGSLNNVSDNSYFTHHFEGLNRYFLPTAGDCLNLIYRKLYKERGSLEVAVSPLACFQAIYPIVLNGHIPVFVDVNKETFNIDTSQLLSRNDVDAVELIHLGGNPNEMDVICKWAKEHGIIIVEDCAQALGSSFEGKELGCFGDYAVFSLIKNLHTSIGGLLVSRPQFVIDDFKQVSKLLVYYRRIKRFLESKSNHHRYNMWNAMYFLLLRLKEKGVPKPNNSIHCLPENIIRALSNTISIIDDLNIKRKEKYLYVTSKIDRSKYHLQETPEGGLSNMNRILLRINMPNAIQIIEGLRKAGVAANNFTQNYLKGFQRHVSEDELLAPYYNALDLKNYDAIFNRIIAIPCSPFLSQEEMDYIVCKLNHIQ